jgi:hypothetical protein
MPRSDESGQPMHADALRVASDTPRCRSIACDFPAQGELGFCELCEDVHRAAQTLRETLLARRGARVRARDPELFDELPPRMRRRLLTHIAAQPARGSEGLRRLVGLEDFFADMAELGLVPAESVSP